jgi:predicted permease
MNGLINDLRYAWRGLLKSPILSLAVVLSLALGIGANTTIFTIVNAVFLRPVPFAKPAELVGVFATDRHVDKLLPHSYLNFRDFSARNKSFSGLAAEWRIPLTLTIDGKQQLAFAQLVSGNYFDVLGVKPVLGRGFLPAEDETPGKSPVVVLSYKFWTNRFKADPNIVGKDLIVDGRPYKIVGVAPSNFNSIRQFSSPSLWVPAMMHEQVLSGTAAGGLDAFFNRHENLMNVVGRLKPGVSQAAAEADLKGIAKQLEKEHLRENIDRSVELLPITQSTLDPNRRDSMILIGVLLFGVVSLVLFIACANIANLLLARATSRQREIAIRLAMGASRNRLLRQLLIESTLLALLGGLVGLAVATWGKGRLWAVSSPFLPFSVDLKLDTKVLLFTLGLSVLTGLLFGLAPAIQASRPSLVPGLKEQESGGHRFNRRFGVGSILVVAQVALCLVALILSGLFLRSLNQMQRTDPGFETEQMALISFSDLAGQGYTPDQTAQFYKDVIAKVAKVPGVEAAAMSEFMPLVDGGAIRYIFLNGQHQYQGGYGVPVLSAVVGAGYFKTMGIPVVSGREFDQNDYMKFYGEGHEVTVDGKPLVLINETMAKKYWPGQNPIGHKLQAFGVPPYFEVLGVVKDSKYVSLGEEPRPYIYFSLTQHTRPVMSMFIRTGDDPKAALEGARKAVLELDPKMPLLNVATYSEVMEQALLIPRLGAGLLALFGVLALALAMIGTFGVMAYLMGQRRYEIGIRMALGADRADVLKLVLGQGMKIVALGIVLGLILSYATTHAFSEFLTGVSAFDAVSFWGSALVLLAVAFFAVYLSTRRATGVDPMVALRYD